MDDPTLPDWVEGPAPQFISPEARKRLDHLLTVSKQTTEQLIRETQRAALGAPFAIEESYKVLPKELQKAARLQQRDILYLRFPTGILLAVALFGALGLLTRANAYRKLLVVIWRRLNGDGMRLKGK